MPIPSPKASELQKDFISRCYTDIKDEYDDNRAFGICYTRWREKKMERISKLTRKPKKS